MPPKNRNIAYCDVQYGIDKGRNNQGLSKNRTQFSFSISIFIDK